MGKSQIDSLVLVFDVVSYAEITKSFRHNLKWQVMFLQYKDRKRRCFEPFACNQKKFWTPCLF